MDLGSESLKDVGSTSSGSQSIKDSGLRIPSRLWTQNPFEILGSESFRDWAPNSSMSMGPQNEFDIMICVKFVRATGAQAFYQTVAQL